MQPCGCACHGSRASGAKVTSLTVKRPASIRALETVPSAMTVAVVYHLDDAGAGKANGYFSDLMNLTRARASLRGTVPFLITIVITFLW